MFRDFKGRLELLNSFYAIGFSKKTSELGNFNFKIEPEIVIKKKTQFENTEIWPENRILTHRTSENITSKMESV